MNLQITWTASDVRNATDRELTDDQCTQVLKAIRDSYNIDVGINTYVIRDTVEYLFNHD